MRITLVAHGLTLGSRRGIFGDHTDLLPDAPLPHLPTHHTGLILSGPEPACRRTAEMLQGSVRIDDDLRGPDAGEWSGMSLDEVAADPASLQQLRTWIGSPSAAPPGGESLTGHLDRISSVLDSDQWPDSGAVIVASSSTVRAACAYAMDAPAQSLTRLDVAPGSYATITRRPGGPWHLRAIVPPSRSERHTTESTE